MGRCGRDVMRGTAFADPAVGVSGRGAWKASARAKLRLRRQRSPSFAVMLPWLAVCRRAALRPVFDSPYALKSAFVNVARSLSSEDSVELEQRLPLGLLL